MLCYISLEICFNRVLKCQLLRELRQVKHSRSVNSCLIVKPKRESTAVYVSCSCRRRWQPWKIMIFRGVDKQPVCCCMLLLCPPRAIYCSEVLNFPKEKKNPFMGTGFFSECLWQSISSSFSVTKLPIRNEKSQLW